MAGMPNSKGRSSGRKQWKLYGTDARGKMYSFNAHIGDSDDPESQFLLAKQLLTEETDIDAVQEENYRQGIYWLIRSSEQGSVEATTLLTDCLNTGKGINEHNILDVKKCLSMSLEEKLSIRAAHNMFNKMSVGEDFITSEQLWKEMSATTSSQSKTNNACLREGDTRDKDSDWKQLDQKGEKITADNLVSAAVLYSHGQLPENMDQLMLHNDHRTNSKSLVYLLAYPNRCIQSLCYYISDTFGPEYVFSSFKFSWDQIRLFLIIMLFLTFSIDDITSMLPSFAYYFSLVVMVGATCQIIKHKRQFHRFRNWSLLFIEYSGGSLNPNEAEYQHYKSGLRPYVYFFVFLLIHLLLNCYGTFAVNFHSELTVLAFFFTFLTLYTFTLTGPRYGGIQYKIDALGLFSFAVHVLAKYPYEEDTVVGLGWRFLDINVPTFASYIVGNGVEFCLNFRALFYLTIPGMLLKMAFRNSSRGIFTDLIPHCVTLSWWQLTIIFSQGATWYGLVRSALAVVGFVLFLPLTALATIILPVVAFVKCMTIQEGLSLIATCAAAILIPYATFYYSKYRGSNGKILFLIQLLSCITAGFLFLKVSFPTSLLQRDIKSTSDLSWNQFTKLCGPQSIQSSEINKQLACSELLGLSIHWEGYVKSTTITKIRNPVTFFTSKLPYEIAKRLNCYFGEKKSFCGPDDEACSEIPNELNSCHLNNWNRYDLEILIEVRTGTWSAMEGQLILSAGNSFFNFTRFLTPDDKIWFSGYLESDANGILSSTNPRIQLSSVGCLSCSEASLSTEDNSSSIKLTDVYKYVRYVLNFLLNPLVVLT